MTHFRYTESVLIERALGKGIMIVQDVLGARYEQNRQPLDSGLEGVEFRSERLMEVLGW
jgi:hypothetical protein